MQTPAWVTNDGRAISLSTMTTAHVQNVLAYLHAGDGERGPLLRPGCSGFTNAEWLVLMAAELTRRARLGRDATCCTPGTACWTCHLPCARRCWSRCSHPKPTHDLLVVESVPGAGNMSTTSSLQYRCSSSVRNLLS